MQCAIRSTPVLKKCASDHLSSFIARSGRLHFQTTSIIIVVKEHSISCIFYSAFTHQAIFMGFKLLKKKRKFLKLVKSSCYAIIMIPIHTIHNIPPTIPQVPFF